jgi:hypothetical protein
VEIFRLSGMCPTDQQRRVDGTTDGEQLCFAIILALKRISDFEDEHNWKSRCSKTCFVPSERVWFRGSGLEALTGCLSDLTRTERMIAWDHPDRSCIGGKHAMTKEQHAEKAVKQVMRDLRLLPSNMPSFVEVAVFVILWGLTIGLAILIG